MQKPSRAKRNVLATAYAGQHQLKSVSHKANATPIEVC